MHGVIAAAGVALLASSCAASPPVSRASKASGTATLATDWTGTLNDGPAPAASAAAPSALPREAWVLHVGDSFVDAWFRQNLGPRFREAGTTYVASGVTATYTTTWASSAQLDAWLARRPALVIVTLGANEVDIPVPEQHARAVAAIARKIARAGAACVWTTPPTWRVDTGILQVIYEHAAPCLFFDSDAALGGLAPSERQGDRIHPNRKGGARWAEVFWEWLKAHRDPSRGPWALQPFETRVD
jgi:hypothetical protein